MINDIMRSRRMRAATLTALGVVLVWQVMIGSFTAYLASEAPEWALDLQATNPTALVALADRRLNPQASEGAESKLSRQEAADSAAQRQVVGDRLGGWAEIAMKAVAQRLGPVSHDNRPDARESQQPQPALLPDSTRLQIRAQAEQALFHDPLNARALRILGQLSDADGDQTKAGALMEAAAQRSLRETVAFYWLMSKSLEKKDVPAALRYEDTFLRTRPQFMSYAMPILVRLAEEKDKKAEDATNNSESANTALKRLLASNPPWRSQFFAALPNSVSDARTPLDLLLSLKDTPAPPTIEELNPYLRYLVAHRLYELAFYAWLQFLPTEQLATLSLPFNNSFEFPPSGLPFDWEVSSGSGVTIDFGPRPDQKNAHALYLEFGPGRAEFGGVSQLVMLAPGAYRLKGQYKGEIEGRRGLQWRITCADSEGAPLAETPMFLGTAQSWTDFSVSFIVSNEGCNAQELRLVLAARSASEQLVSGSIWYDELQIQRVVESAEPPRDADRR